ncbi:thiazole tautomerase TenI [Peribacillus frigoritolerans]|jgi:thiazole tautomerase (transcriptional regulator TenI)|uniref:thiazole tautomerase TenI n=1 Tax=Peribacillus frigoritolerans TaxID=450367 RepID=UPI00207B0C3A|nr:thiazole tautomerase TenI [Peribacillus frigoritolerans]USK76996.1 thiazole tautomerase TenI [Peribacillus frigoritolerans]
MDAHELHIISTGKQPIEKFVEIASNIQEHVDYFYLREKHRSASELYRAVTLLHDNKIPLSKIIVNDRVDVAWVHKVFGVQLAFHSLDAEIVKEAFPGMNVGCSIHSMDEAKAAFSKGADYAIYGHVFETVSKIGLPPKGVEELHAITRNVNLPLIAIGGITPFNCQAVLDAGARGIAVMSGVLEAENPVEAVKEYAKSLGKET